MTPRDSGSELYRDERAVRGVRLRRRISRRRWTRIHRITYEVLLVLGLMLVPALAACDFTVWLSCRDMSRSECLALLSRTISLSGAAETGGARETNPVPW